MAMRSGRDGIWTQALKLPGWTLKLPSHTTSYVTWTFVGARDTRCVCHTHFCYVLFSAGNLQENLDGDSFLRLIPEKILGRTSVTWWMDTEYQLPWRESQVQTKKKKKKESKIPPISSSLGENQQHCNKYPDSFILRWEGSFWIIWFISPILISNYATD